MTTNVHILATCGLNGDLRPALLVFKTLRIGFPTLPIFVWGNGLLPGEQERVRSACRQSNADFEMIPRHNHDVWLDLLFKKEANPFWICDTDIVFHRSVEGTVDQETLFKGLYEPSFIEPWTKTIKTARLHTSLLYFNAPVLRRAVSEWIRRWHPPGFPFQPEVQMIRQCFVPSSPGQPPMFQDTAAGLYAAVGGESFDDNERTAFDHLHCATYVEAMKNAVPGLKAAHETIYADHSNAPLMRESQREFYERQHAAQH